MFLRANIFSLGYAGYRSDMEVVTNVRPELHLLFKRHKILSDDSQENH